MNETLFTIIKYVVGILTLVVFRYAIPFAKVKLENSKYANVLDFVEKCINAAESIYKNVPKSGDAKKAYVIKTATDYINKTKFKLTEEQMNVLIEGIFRELDGDTINTNN